jgi:Cu-Zn family superoxide dismutase
MRTLIVLAAFSFACAGTSKQQPAPIAASAASGAQVATVTLEPRSGSNVTGTARFSPAPDGVSARVEIANAAPGLHGVHIHEKGDCSDPKATSAGGHFNPGAGAHHGGPSTPVRHGGDLGNINVDTNGRGTLDVTVQGLSVGSGSNGIAGRALVVHEKADDLQTDPAGNSGARIACGVIQGSQPGSPQPATSQPGTPQPSR